MNLRGHIDPRADFHELQLEARDPAIYHQMAYPTEADRHFAFLRPEAVAVELAVREQTPGMTLAHQGELSGAVSHLYRLREEHANVTAKIRVLRESERRLTRAPLPYLAGIEMGPTVIPTENLNRFEGAARTLERRLLLALRLEIQQLESAILEFIEENKNSAARFNRSEPLQANRTE